MSELDYKEKLKELFSEEELEKEINKRIDKFQGLLTREVAMKLIAKEKGLLRAEPRMYKIAEIPKAGRKISFRGRVLHIASPIKYSSGKISRNVIIGDDSGRIRLKLWGEDLKFFSRFKLGDIVQVKNAYEKNNELSLGYAGEITVVAPSPFTPLSMLEPSKYVNIKARVSEIEGEKEYKREGISRKYFVFWITDGEKQKKCIIWEGIGRGAKLNKGDEVILEKAYVKGEDIYLYNSGRLLSKPGKSENYGKIEEIECVGEKLILKMNDRNVELSRQDALKLLDVEVAEDIALESIVKLKKQALLNKNIRIQTNS